MFEMIFFLENETPLYINGMTYSQSTLSPDICSQTEKNNSTQVIR